MTNDLHATTQSLITDIEKKDRRFRVAQSVFMAAALVGLAIAVVLGYSILNNTQHDITDHQLQVINLQGQIKTADKDNAMKLQDLQNHIDCIVALFQRPNRASLVITDITQCQLKNLEAATSPSKNSSPQQAGQVAKPADGPTSTATVQHNVPAPAPHPLVCTLTLGLLGCK